MDNGRMRVHAFVLLIAIAGCKSGKKDDKAREPEKTAAADATAKAAPPDAAPPAPDAAPAVKTKHVAFDEIGQSHAMEIDIPEDAKTESQPFTEEAFAHATVTLASGTEIQIEEPDAGQGTFQEEQDMAMRASGDPKLERADQDPDGYTIIYSANKYGTTTRAWNASVDWLSLQIKCGAYELPSRAEADAVITICKTLREKK
jgi:hypothetical protein